MNVTEQGRTASAITTLIYAVVTVPHGGEDCPTRPQIMGPDPMIPLGDTGRVEDTLR